MKFKVRSEKIDFKQIATILKSNLRINFKQIATILKANRKVPNRLFKDLSSPSLKDYDWRRKDVFFKEKATLPRQLS